MGYTALYREWRPRCFEDVVGQEHVTVTLKNQIINNRIGHAYLLCGTRGTGKTSTAKILSKAVNCLNLQEGEPCNQCAMCQKINSGISLDVTELDAASHNGVDNIRDIIEDVQYPPQEARYKVYIIDEVHMLSIGAVNAFLKTLEEPPEKVIFILATTDPQKLPITILSRCQRFDFKRIKSSEITERLRKIVKEKGIFADDRSLDLISRMCDGAMRDALSILDQAIAMGNGKVDYNQVINMLGLVTNDNLIKLVDRIIEKDIESSLKLVEDIVFSGKDINIFIKDMITHLRNLMMVKVSDRPEEIIDMSLENIEIIREQSEKIRVEEIMRHIRILQEAEEQSKWSKQGRIYLELAIIKMCKVEYDISKEILLTRINKLEKIIKEGDIKISSPKKETKNTINNTLKLEKTKENKEVMEEVVVENTNSKINIDTVKKSWKDILELFKGRRLMVIYASLITGKVVNCSNGVIEICYDEEYSFNKKRLEKEEHRKAVEEIFSEALKEKVRIKYSIDKKQEETKSPEELLIETFGEDLVEIIDE